MGPRTTRTPVGVGTRRAPSWGGYSKQHALEWRGFLCPFFCLTSEVWASSRRLLVPVPQRETNCFSSELILDCCINKHQNWQSTCGEFLAAAPGAGPVPPGARRLRAPPPPPPPGGAARHNCSDSASLRPELNSSGLNIATVETCDTETARNRKTGAVCGRNRDGLRNVYDSPGSQIQLEIRGRSIYRI